MIFIRIGVFNIYDTHTYRCAQVLHTAAARRRHLHAGECRGHRVFAGVLHPGHGVVHGALRTNPVLSRAAMRLVFWREISENEATRFSASTLPCGLYFGGKTVFLPDTSEHETARFSASTLPWGRAATSALKACNRISLRLACMR